MGVAVSDASDLSSSPVSQFDNMAVVTAYETDSFSYKTCERICGALSKCISHLNQNAWHKGGRFMMFGLSKSCIKPIMLKMLYTGYDEDTTGKVDEWTPFAVATLNSNAFFRQFLMNEGGKPGLRNSSNNKSYYVLVSFGKLLDELAQSQVVFFFRKMSYKFVQIGSCIIYPLAAILRNQYEQLELEVLGKKNAVLTKSEWEKLCISENVRPQQLEKLTHLKGRCLQALFFLYCCDGSIDNITHANTYVVMSDFSVPVEFYDTEAEAVKASSKRERTNPPASLCEKIESDWEITSLAPVETCTPDFNNLLLIQRE